MEMDGLVVAHSRDESGSGGSVGPETQLRPCVDVTSSTHGATI